MIADAETMAKPTVCVHYRDEIFIRRHTCYCKCCDRACCVRAMSVSVDGLQLGRGGVGGVREVSDIRHHLKGESPLKHIQISNHSLQGVCNSGQEAADTHLAMRLVHSVHSHHHVCGWASRRAGV